MKTNDKVGSYYSEFKKVMENIAVTDKTGKSFCLQSGLLKAVGLIFACRGKRGKLIFIGNGASASISSYMATDFRCR